MEGDNAIIVSLAAGRCGPNGQKVFVCLAERREKQTGSFFMCFHVASGVNYAGNDSCCVFGNPGLLFGVHAMANGRHGRGNGETLVL
jgi:hypothetical protein